MYDLHELSKKDKKSFKDLSLSLNKKILKIDLLKDKLLSLAPYDPVIKSHFEKYLDIELTYNTNVIEGNTLTYNDTKFILNEGYTTDKSKNVNEILEVINHRDAMRYIETLQKKPPYIVSQEEILNTHREILKGIDNLNAGKYRQQKVFTKREDGTIKYYPDHKEVPQLITATLKNLIASSKDLHPVLLACNFHNDFIEAHPFIDGNGRTARLIMNLILIQNNYPMINIKKENKSEYISNIIETNENKNSKPFSFFIANKLKEMLKLHIKTYSEGIIWK